MGHKSEDRTELSNQKQRTGHMWYSVASYSNGLTKSKMDSTTMEEGRRNRGRLNVLPEWTHLGDICKRSLYIRNRNQGNDV